MTLFTPLDTGLTRVEREVSGGHGVVQWSHGGPSSWFLTLHVLQDVDDAVPGLLLLHLLEHQLAHLGQLLDHAQLPRQLGGVDHLGDGEGLNTAWDG